MDPLTSTATAGLRARIESLDLLSNNLANSGTSGYKADRESYALYLSEESRGAQEGGFGQGQSAAPLIEKQWTDLRQGLLQKTDDARDLALEGPGFFLVTGPNGALLTRNGSFSVAKDGRLMTREGYEFQTVEPRRIRAQPGIPVTVRDDGTVLQEGAVLGRLRVVEAPPVSAIDKREGVYFTLDSRRLGALKASDAVVRQGEVESSNVNPAESATRLIDILRQFEGLQKAIQIGGEMNKKSIEELARVAT